MNETNIELQLIQINKKLDKITNPFKVAGLQFVSGLFHALGNLFGMIIITLALIYIFSYFKLDKLLIDYIQSAIPKPQINIQSPF